MRPEGPAAEGPEVLAAEDAFMWALRLFRAAADPQGYEPANLRVQALVAQLEEQGLRDVAEALALMPRFAARPLTEQRELDRLEVLFGWVFS